MNILKNRFYPYFFWIATAFLFLFEIHNIPLWSSDEGRFGEIAREMWQTRDFIVPKFNYLDFLEKPVLAPFLTALGYGLFGVNSLVTRIPVILSALGGIALCGFFTKRFFGSQTAKVAAILLTTSFGYFVVGRFAVIDTIMNFWVTGTLFCMLTACLEKNSKFYLLAYTLMGFGFLTKGLIAFVLPAFIFSGFLVWTGNLKELLKMRLWQGLLIILLIVSPWIISILIREPRFFEIFILRQHFARFSGTESFGRGRPFWFSSLFCL